MKQKEETAYEKGYRVAENGDLIGPRGNTLVPHASGNGYPWFRYERGSICVPTHRLVAYQKFGRDLYTPGLEVRHKDNDFENNSWGNLLLGNKSQNMMDKPPEERKRIARIAALAQRKLSEGEAQQLRNDHVAGLSYRQLMKKYGIAKSTVSYIVNKRTYSLV